jgi:hypothetical protein
VVPERDATVGAGRRKGAKLPVESHRIDAWESAGGGLWHQRSSTGPAHKQASRTVDRDLLACLGRVWQPVALEREVFPCDSSDQAHVSEAGRSVRRPMMRTHDEASLSMCWIATRPSIEPTAKPLAEGKHETVRVCCLSGESWLCARRNADEESSGRQQMMSIIACRAILPTHLEDDARIVQIKDLERPVRASDNHQRVDDVHRVDLVRQLDGRHRVGCRIGSAGSGLSSFDLEEGVMAQEAHAFASPSTSDARVGEDQHQSKRGHEREEDSPLCTCPSRPSQECQHRLPAG